MSNDEIIYFFDSQKLAFDFCRQFKNLNLEKELKCSIRLTYLFPQKIEDRNFYFADVIEDIFSLGGEKTKLEESGKSYRKLIGVPGNQFYIYFKKYTLQEPLEERDLFFQQDNQLAKWIL